MTAGNGEWRPIESAPRDGTAILAYDPEGLGRDKPVWAVVRWYVHQSHHYEDAGGGLYRRVAGENTWWDGAPYTPFHATHWMPLSAPPR